MDESLDNAVNLAKPMRADPPNQSARNPKRARRAKPPHRPTSTDAPPAASVDSELGTVPTALPDSSVVEFRFEKCVTADLLAADGEVLLLVPFQDLKWKEIEVVGRGLGDTLAAICQLPAETFSVAVALGVQAHQHQAQPALQVHVPDRALAMLQQSEVRERLKRSLDLLSDDGLTGLSAVELAARSGIDTRTIDSLRRVRLSVSGRRLESRLIVRIPGQEPMFLSAALCEPYRPAVQKVIKTYRGRFSGYDGDDRLAHFRPDSRKGRMDISFDEPTFLEEIREHSSPKRTFFDVDVVEELADDLPVSYELKEMRVIQEELKFDEPQKQQSDRQATE